MKDTNTLSCNSLSSVSAKYYNLFNIVKEFMVFWLVWNLQLSESESHLACMGLIVEVSSLYEQYNVKKNNI